MRQKNLVIFDSEISYAKRLMEKISGRREVSFRVYVFTEMEKLEQFSKKQGVDYLLIDEACSKTVREGVGARRILLLSKNEEKENEEGITCIFKYQSVDKIVEMILEGCKSSASGGILRKKREGAGRVLAVYSPIHRIGKTRFAIELGKKLAKEAPTLYMNLEEYAGRNLPKGEAQQGLSELLYYAKQENSNLGIRLGSMVYPRGALDCVAPMLIAQDIRAVTEEEWLDLFRQILEQSIYETIILDIGESIQGIYGILKMCQTVYTPYIETQPEKAKLSQYVENLHTLGLESILEHTIQKQMKEGR
ncbi:MAG: hypothetical protein PHN80_02815 [Hespellia sp.]|nr:hypothetical protein [Hespellia sp.]